MSVVGLTTIRRALVGSCAAALAASSLVGAASPSGASAPSLAALPAGPALSTLADTSMWGTNGRVTDIVSDGTSAWISGAFDYVGPTTGRGVLVNGSTGARLSADGIRADGPVRASAADGAGGYYLAGSFARIGATRRYGLAHVLADGTLDQAFTPVVVGTATVPAEIKAIAVAGDRLVVGGSFTTIGGVATGGLAALALDGTLVPGWGSGTSGTVNSLKVVGDEVYVGGAFATVSGSPSANLARVRLADGSRDVAFAATANAPVRALDVVAGPTHDLDVVYVGGDFTSLTAQGVARSHARIAALGGLGNDRGWAAIASAPVQSIAVEPNHNSLLVGGAFLTVNGVARARAARLTTGGAVVGFDAKLDGCHAPHTVQYTYQLAPCTPEVNSVSWSATGDTIYVGGVFTTAQGQIRHDAAAFSLATGAVTAWSPMPGSRVSTVAAVPGGILLGGDFTSVGGYYRRGLAKLNLSTGRADPVWRADTDNIVLDIELNATRTTLYVGGAFTRVAGLPRTSVAAIDPGNAHVSSVFSTPVNKPVLSLAVRGSYVYLGGLFTAVGSVARSHAARVSSYYGTADSWVANTIGTGLTQRDGGAVTSLAVTRSGSRVFLAGGFTSVNNLTTWGGITTVTGSTGAVNPSRLGGVQRCGNTYGINRIYLSADDQRLYGGDLCPDNVYQWDAVNLAASPATGVPGKYGGLNWMTSCNSGMQGRLEVNGHFYYGTHGGDVGFGGWCNTSKSDSTRIAQQRAFVFSAVDASVLDWAPTFDAPMGVWAYAAVPQGLLVGGDFTIGGDRSVVQQGLALFRGTP
ncbi:MAG: hypothetical protein M3Y71_03575 [Actinomycetota bacterium]|nr:hypothetical protein [Actinomycetota bacterium]